MSLKYYAEGVNAIKIQILGLLVAIQLIKIHIRWLTRSWSYYGQATILRIPLKSYYDFFSLFNHAGKGRERALVKEVESLLQDPHFLTTGAWKSMLEITSAPIL